MDIYEKYYLSDEKIDEILKNGIVIFDTSALLDLYYYSKSSQEVIFDKIFGFFSDRLWISAQVYFEFLKNKSDVAEKPIASYNNLIHDPKGKADGGHIDKIVKLSEELPLKLSLIKNQMKTLKEKTIHEEKYPNISSSEYTDFDRAIENLDCQIKEFIANANRFSSTFKNAVDMKIELIKKEKEEDRVLQAIDSKFKIGQELTYEQQMIISREGAFRYAEQIPPGYKDAEEKIGMQKYGDLFAWKQILELGSKEKKPILLIINDVKEDWYDKELEAPRYELLKEFQSICKQPFWTYTMKQFIYHVNHIIKTEQDVFEQMLKETDEIQEVKSYNAIDDVDYIDIINEYFAPEVLVEKEIQLADELRIIGDTRAFVGKTNEGKPALVMVNMTKGSKYVNGLHPLRNMQEVKKYFKNINIEYTYSQLIICSTKEVAFNMYKNQFEKKNIKNLFRRKDVNVFIGYVEDNNFNAIASNVDKK